MDGDGGPTTIEKATIPLWERRYRAPSISSFEWSPGAPDRIVFVSNETGIRQIHAWDRASGMRRQVTDHPVGVIVGAPTLDGTRIVWFEDETGDEAGRWLAQPFPGGRTEAFLDGVPHGWSGGLAQAAGVVAAAINDREGFGVYVAAAGSTARRVLHSTEAVWIGGGEAGGPSRAGLSADGSLLCLEHSEHGDLLHPALRVVDPSSGDTMAEQLDVNMSLVAACWSPVPGDQRLAIVHERDGEGRPAIWNLETNERTDVRLPLDGLVHVFDWWPDASALLLGHLFEGRSRLLRYDVASGEVVPLGPPRGTIRAARVRPDGGTWHLSSTGDREPMVADDSGDEVVAAEGASAPPGRPYVSWHFDNAAGQRVHGFYVAPAGDGPWPVVMLVHGGPTFLDTDAWDPEVQAYVDAGFCVGMVNYRGSVGYGREWRDTLIGDVGGPELEDVNSGLADLIARGVADRARAVIAGWSWGGYVTLLELGKHPDLWVCGVAGVPVGDYEASYDDSSPLLQAYDRGLLGGVTPHDIPDLMRNRSPIYFVGSLRAPVLIIAGEADSRCPIRQVKNYIEKLDERDHPHEVYFFPTGHGSLDTEERVRQMAVILDFLERRVPSPP
jgi:dipeptidyl aminopeptidase/acylaminoacyl peptidase